MIEPDLDESVLSVSSYGFFDPALQPSLNKICSNQENK